MTATSAVRDRFRELHASGTFVMPNPHDLGSARLLAALGFQALASTSSGFAATLGRMDMTVSRDELLVHIDALSSATPLPVNADSERLFADDLAGVTEAVELLGDAGASGCSIEDWNPSTDSIDPFDVAVTRVAAAAAGAASNGVVLTARCENLLHGVQDLEDTIERLRAYVQAGADVAYAPGLVDLDQIERVVKAVTVPVNVLLRPGGPSVAQLASVGVRRISTGGLLSHIANGAVVAAATRLRDEGMINASEPMLDRALAAQAFNPR
jgi:2-methylisocitrate lyase-like PEP mutase family enzyme